MVDGDVDIEGTRLSCNVGNGDWLGCSLGRDVGMALCDGVELGALDGAVLIDGS